MSELSAIKFQIEKHWTVPAGAQDAEDLINLEGSLAGVERSLNKILKMWFSLVLKKFVPKNIEDKLKDKLK